VDDAAGEPAEAGDEAEPPPAAKAVLEVLSRELGLPDDSSVETVLAALGGGGARDEQE